MNWCWHKWTKWVRGGPLFKIMRRKHLGFTKIQVGEWQRRECSKCGKSQLRDVE